MVTTEEVERYYAEKLGIDSDSDYSSFPSSVLHQLVSSDYIIRFPK